MRSAAAIFALTVLMAAAAQAAPGKPAAIDGVIHAQSPYGSGSYSIFWTTIYDAALWTDAPQWSWQNPFALTLRYHVDVEAAELRDRSIDEMNKISPLSDEQAARYAAQLAPVLPDVAPGDQITALYLPDNGIDFYHNGASTGSIKDPQFARLFFAIWLSERTSAPHLRAALLSGAPHHGE